MLFIETGYYLIFNSKLNSSSLFIFSETNLNETKEFLLFYFKDNLLAFLFSLIVISVISFLKTRNSSIEFLRIKKRFFVITVISFFTISLLLISYTRRENLPYIIAKSFYDLNKDSYYDDKESYGAPFGPFKNQLDTENNQKETVVIVIGESVSKRHLNIYGYNRNTTPLLNQIKEELLVYNNVITPHGLTTKSLRKALTLDETNGSIIQLLNSQGFETYWLSNQNPIGVFESLVSKIAKASDNKTFLTTARFMNNKIYDEELIQELDGVLNKEIRRKAIFIHMQGTHFDYKYRYTEEYDFFDDKPESELSLNDEENEIVNHYDNAILYHDYVLSTIIKTVKNKNDSSSILYFSDHGEEVYDTMSFSGHNDEIMSLPVFEIPFFLWMSEKFKRNNDVQVNLDRPYMTDDLFHSIAHLSGINSEIVDFERSIFSKEFKSKKRIILNNKNYDSLLLKAIIKN